MNEFDIIMAEQFEFVKAISQKSGKSSVVLRHRKSGKKVVKILAEGNGEIYRILAGVSHPNLPEILNVSTQANKTEIIEEYIDGISISEVLQTGLYNEKGAITVACEICKALSALHSLNIIHRDIKPENVMIDKKGNVKLIDFDAARLYKSYQPRDTVAIGTAGFAAPEQFGIGQTDFRSDIFALGILLNVMLTGEHPSRRIYNGKLGSIIEKCINIDPNRRWGNVYQLHEALVNI